MFGFSLIHGRVSSYKVWEVARALSFFIKLQLWIASSCYQLKVTQIGTATMPEAPTSKTAKASTTERSGQTVRKLPLRQSSKGWKRLTSYPNVL
jgi:hypothetical protein